LGRWLNLNLSGIFLLLLPSGTSWLGHPIIKPG
jgi:hypothetical protein